MVDLIEGGANVTAVQPQDYEVAGLSALPGIGSGRFETKDKCSKLSG